jgi:hypothetical protein
MTIIVTASRPRRDDRVATHTYKVPVVRELPAQPADAPGDLTW